MFVTLTHQDHREFPIGIIEKFPKIPAAREASNTSSIRIDLTCIGVIGLHYNVYIRTHGLVKAKGTVYFVKARIS